jgi:hypothetical protein
MYIIKFISLSLTLQSPVRHYMSIKSNIVDTRYIQAVLSDLVNETEWIDKLS